MFKMFEAAGDRLLSLVVPRIVATADPGCECSGYGTNTVKCGCASIPGTSWKTLHKRKITCNGCHWVPGACNPVEVVFSC